MPHRSHRGLAYRRGQPTAVRLPLAREATIEVRWRGGGFSVHGSPWELEAFAAGHLVSEGYIPSFRAVRSIAVNPRAEDRLRVEVELDRAPPSRGLRRDNVLWGADRRSSPRARGRKRTRIRPRDLLTLAESLHRQERALRAAGPLHWAALYDPSTRAILLASDLSRHSAIDKVIGKALLSGLPIENRILYSSGRVGEEMTAKAVRVGAGALTTRSVPFRGAVELAEQQHLLLVGKLGPAGFLVYAGKGRLSRAPRA